MFMPTKRKTTDLNDTIQFDHDDDGASLFIPWSVLRPILKQLVAMISRHPKNR